MRSYAILSMVGLAYAGSPVIKMAQAGPPPTGPVIQEIMVGGLNGGSNLQFTPSSVVAKVGDTIRFNFVGGENNVIQTTFEQPCTPMPGGFVSGPQQNPANTFPGPTVDYQVTVLTPLWFTSQVNNACGQGMVFAINAPTGGGKTLSDFQAIALKNSALPNLKNAALQVDQPVPQLASTVSINVGAAGVAAAATGAPGSVGTAGSAGAPGSAGSVGAPGSPSVIAGQGTTGSGQSCGCSCLCGQGSFPPNAGVGEFGGFLGTMPISGATQVGVMPPGGAAPTGAVRMIRH